jgi:hypothetical protein
MIYLNTSPPPLFSSETEFSLTWKARGSPIRPSFQWKQESRDRILDARFREHDRKKRLLLN